MAYRRVVNGVDDINDVDLDQYADSFNGVGGKGQPLDLIALDADRYYQVIKNLNANSKVAQFYKQDGTLLFQVDGSGVKASIDGSANAVALAGQASPRFTGTVALSGRVLRRRSSTVASAATLTLPSDGDIIPVSGTVTVTSITAIALTNIVDGPVVTLEFQSAGCRVVMGATLRLRGDFVSSAAGDTLTISGDGTNWNEVGRGRSGSQAVLAQAAGQTLVDGAAYAVMALAAATSDRFGIKSGNTFVAPWAGLWRAEGALNIETSSAGNRNVAIHKGGALVSVVGHTSGSSSALDWGCSWSLPMNLVAGDVIDVRAKVNGTNLLIRTSSYSALTYVGPA